MAKAKIASTGEPIKAIRRWNGSRWVKHVGYYMFNPDATYKYGWRAINDYPSVFCTVSPSDGSEAMMYQFDSETGDILRLVDTNHPVLVDMEADGDREIYTIFLEADNTQIYVRYYRRYLLDDAKKGLVGPCWYSDPYSSLTYNIYDETCTSMCLRGFQDIIYTIKKTGIEGSNKIVKYNNPTLVKTTLPDTDVPVDVAVGANNYIYMVCEKSIQKLDASFNVVKSVPISGTELYGKYIVIDKSGNVYVCTQQYTTIKILKYTSDLVYVTEDWWVGDIPYKPVLNGSHLLIPIQINSSGKGRLVICNLATFPSGEFSYYVYDTIYGACFDEEGYILLAGYDTTYTSVILRKIDSVGNVFWTIPLNYVEKNDTVRLYGDRGAYGRF